MRSARMPRARVQGGLPDDARDDILSQVSRLTSLATEILRLSAVIYSRIVADSQRTPPSAAGAPSRAARQTADSGERISLDESLRELVLCRMRLAGVTQVELAKRMGVKPPVVNRFLKHPTSAKVVTWDRIAKALGMADAAELMQPLAPDALPPETWAAIQA